MSDEISPFKDKNGGEVLTSSDADEHEFLDIDISELKKMKVSELREKLSELGLSTKGNKAELIVRLEQHLQSVAETDPEIGFFEESNVTLNVTDVEQDDSCILLESDTTNQSNIESEKTSVSTLLSIKPPTNVANEEVVSISPTNPKAKIQIQTSNLLSFDEKVKLRAEKFGEIASDDMKKKIRSDRFKGSEGPILKSSMVSEDVVKMKKRGERFGENVSKQILALSDGERKLKRSERFGSSSEIDSNKKLKISTI